MGHLRGHRFTGCWHLGLVQPRYRCRQARGGDRDSIDYRPGHCGGCVVRPVCLRQLCPFPAGALGVLLVVVPWAVLSGGDDFSTGGRRSVLACLIGCQGSWPAHLPPARHATIYG